MQVTEDTPLIDLLQNPKTAAVLARHGLPCLSCPAVGFEMRFLKIGQVARIYGLNLEELLRELNEVVK